MKKTIILLLLPLFTFSSLNATEEIFEAKISESRQTAKVFGQQLKSELVKAMKSGGPIKAIDVCNEKAPAIATHMKSLGTPIARTSLKYRSANNKPDEWEQQTLNHFEKMKTKGVVLEKIEHFEIVEEEGERYFRYMKAIPTLAKCLACHGETIAPSIAKKLEVLYPDDKAIGFQVGDIRGAFTFKEKL